MDHVVLSSVGLCLCWCWSCGISFVWQVGLGWLNASRAVTPQQSLMIFNSSDNGNTLSMIHSL